MVLSLFLVQNRAVFLTLLLFAILILFITGNGRAYGKVLRMTITASVENGSLAEKTSNSCGRLIIAC